MERVNLEMNQCIGENKYLKPYSKRKGIYQLVKRLTVDNLLICRETKYHGTKTFNLKEGFYTNG